MVLGFIESDKEDLAGVRTKEFEMEIEECLRLTKEKKRRAIEIATVAHTLVEEIIVDGILGIRIGLLQF